MSDCFDQLEAIEGDELEVPDDFLFETVILMPTRKPGTSRADRLEEVTSRLEAVNEALGDFLDERKETMREETRSSIEHIIERMGDSIENARSVSFPGMF